MAKRLFDMAFGSGVNVVDLYYLGLAEEVAGQALGSKRNDILLATKGAPWMRTPPMRALPAII